MHTSLRTLIRRATADDGRSDPARIASVVNAFIERGESARALRWIRAAVRRDGEHSILPYMRAKTLASLGRYPEALEYYQKAIALDPSALQVSSELGWLLVQCLNDYETARRHFERIVRAGGPDTVDVLQGLATCAIQGRDFAAAWKDASAAIEGTGRDPAKLQCAIGAELLRYGRYAEGEECARRLVDHRHLGSTPLVLLSQAAEQQRDLAGAKQYLLRAREEFPHDHSSIPPLILLYGRTGEWDSARTLFRDVWPLFKEKVFPHVNPNRIWGGEPLGGKTVLLDTRFAVGYGEAIQNARFVPLLHDMGAKVVLVCRKPLLTLLSGLRGLDTIVEPYEDRPAVDYLVDSGLAWLLIDLPPEEIGSMVPYVVVTEGRQASGQRWVGKTVGLKIGLAWKSSEVRSPNPYTARSLPTETLRPLNGLPDVRWFNLQVGSSAIDIGEVFDRGGVQQCGAELRTFADTAAIMDELDMVIAPDTAVAHLAGALGKPVQLMLPYASDWRWQGASLPCIWYPSVTFARQVAPGDWSSVIAHVIRNIENFRRTVC